MNSRILKTKIIKGPEKEMKKSEEELAKLKLEREKLMEEAASHLKGRKRMSDKELAQDIYINVQTNESISENDTEEE